MEPDNKSASDNLPEGVSETEGGGKSDILQENSEDENSGQNSSPSEFNQHNDYAETADSMSTSADEATKDFTSADEAATTASRTKENTANSLESEGERKGNEIGGASENSTSQDEKSMGLLDHLGELRNRLIKATIGVIIGFGICWAFVDPLFEILVHPLLKVLPEGSHAQYTTLPEAFFIRMQIAFVAGLFLASPVIFYQIWAFVAPGLYDEEKRYILPVALLSALFFTGGAAFCYYIVFPFAFNFFISYSTPEIVVTPKISDYINFVLKLLFAFGIIFEMPIFTLFLSRMGLVTAKLMRKGQKYAIVVIFIVAAILTPPDVVSQLLMACPMLALYEISIGVAAVFGKKPKPEAEGAER